MLNAAVGIWGTWLLLPLIKRNVTLLRIKGAVILVLLGDRVYQGRPADDARRGRAVRRQHHLRQKLALPAHRRHKRQDSATRCF